MVSEICGPPGAEGGLPCCVIIDGMQAVVCLRCRRGLPAVQPEDRVSLASGTGGVFSRFLGGERESALFNDTESSEPLASRYI